jgi:soluble lytic murein transglycosylase-like protein
MIVIGSLDLNLNNKELPMADWTELNSLSKQELAKVEYNDPRLDSFSTAVEQRYQLPSGLIEAVKNAGERSNTSQVSPKGAKGVMQFMDDTRKAYQHDYNDPRASINAAGMYFKDLLKQYNGNERSTICPLPLSRKPSIAKLPCSLSRISDHSK